MRGYLLSVTTRLLGKPHEVEQENACLFCGEPSTQETLAEYTVFVMGDGIDHTWLCHRECLREAAHPRFSRRFAKPSSSVV